MKTNFKLLSAACVAVVMASCGGMNYSPGKYAPTNPDKIEVVSLEQLQRPYEILGEYTGNPVLQSMRDWKQKAAEMGADAVSIPEMLPNRYVKLYAIKWKNT
jgi:hypothetical protein